MHRRMRNLQKLLEKTRKSAQAEYENRINVADAEAEKIIENAHKTVELERDKTVQDLSVTDCSSLQWQQQEKYLVRQVRTRITGYCINSFLTKAGGVNDADSK